MKENEGGKKIKYLCSRRRGERRTGLGAGLKKNVEEYEKYVLREVGVWRRGSGGKGWNRGWRPCWKEDA